MLLLELFAILGAAILPSPDSHQPPTLQTPLSFPQAFASGWFSFHILPLIHRHSPRFHPKPICINSLSPSRSLLPATFPLLPPPSPHPPTLMLMMSIYESHPALSLEHQLCFSGCSTDIFNSNHSKLDLT